MKRVETNGVELACEAFGAPSDQAILLVAGLGTQMIRWTAPFCLALAARGYHVIRFDNRDAGGSTHITHRAAPDFGALAAALMAVERGASIVRVHDVRDTVAALAVWRAATAIATSTAANAAAGVGAGATSRPLASPISPPTVAPAVAAAVVAEPAARPAPHQDPRKGSHA